MQITSITVKFDDGSEQVITKVQAEVIAEVDVKNTDGTEEVFVPKE